MKCARFSTAARIAERATVASTLNKLADLNIKVHQYHSQLHSTVGIDPQKTRMGELLLHEQSEFGGLENMVGQVLLGGPAKTSSQCGKHW